MTDSKSPEEPNAPQRRTVAQAVVHVLVFVGGLALYILLGIVLWWALNRYIDPQNSTQKGDVVQALALLMAGVAAAVGIYFTWRGQGITREGQQVSQENIEVTRRSAYEQARLTQEGQNTERYSRAIDQLASTDDQGNKRLEVRLGAIYELEQVSRVSEVLYSPILEVLTSYVRENAPWPPRGLGISEWHSVDSISSETGEVARGNKQEEATSHQVPIDVQAILTVLGRREENRVPEENRVILDLQEVDLRGANLDEAHLEKALLRRAHLEGADLLEANMEEALLRDAHLEGAFLDGANLVGAHLVRANLKGANLVGANLKETNFAEANLEGANLGGANLEGAYLIGANLDTAFLLQEQIEWTIGDDDTKLPENLVDSRPPAWSKTLEEQVKIVRDHIGRG